MAEPGYQRVAGGRPLFFLSPSQSRALHAGLGEARRVSRSRGCAEGRGRDSWAPGAVLAVMTYDVNGAKALLDGAGLDAISAYAFQRRQERAPYARLHGDLEAFWEIQRGSGASVIPLAMAGWDRRRTWKTRCRRKLRRHHGQILRDAHAGGTRHAHPHRGPWTRDQHGRLPRAGGDGVYLE